MENYHNDINIKFEHTPVTNKTAFNLNHVGAHAGDAIAVTTISHTDANTIYVNGSSGNDGNAGTAAAPKLTILASINATTATKIYVLIMNSQHFAEDLSTAVTTFLTGLFANTAITATLSTRVLGYTPADANSIYFGGTSGTGGGVGTAADPTNTIALAVGLTDGTHQNIVEVDGDTYTEPAIEMTGNFLGMYAADGVKPTFKPTYSADTVDYSTGTSIANTTYEPNDTESNNATILNNSNFVIASQDRTDGDSNFVIYNSDGDEVISKTQFTSNDAAEIATTVLTNNSFVIAYSDSSDTDDGKFIIRNQDGSADVAITTFSTSNVGSKDVVGLTNGNFVIVYRDVTATDGQYVIYDNTGSLVTGPTTFESNRATAISLSLLNNDNFVITYLDLDSTNDVKFNIRQQDGTNVSGPTTLDSSSNNFPVVNTLNNNNFVIAYGDSTSSSSKFYIRQQDGTAVSGPTTFDSTRALRKGISTTGNGDFIIAYLDSGDSKGKYVIHNPDGTQVLAPTEFDSGDVDYVSTVVLDTNVTIIAYRADSDTNKGKFIGIQPYSWSGIKVSAASTINGWVVDANNLNQLNNIINVNGAKPTIGWCDLINATNPGTTLIYGYAVQGDNETDINNCAIYDNDSGVYLTSGVDDAIIQDNEFYRNTEAAAIHIDGAAASSGDITIEHNDIFENNSGIRLENNNGTNEIIKNNIIHNNDGDAIEADVSVSLSYSIRTDPLTGATDGSSVILANPLYINEGAVTPSAIDLNIKTKVEGYPSDSPAKDLADDTRNAGSHDVRYIGAATSWTSITVAKPRRGTIDVWYEPVGGQKSVGQDGTVEYSKKGQTENVKIKWVGELKANFDLIRAMWASTESEVRIYFQPTTTPAAYNTYTMTRKTLNASVPLYELSETGVAGHEIEFARKFEEA